jgi:predicted nuclease with TOPRIM domain
MEINNEHRLTEVEERSKSNKHRIDELEKRQDNLDELVTTVKVLAVREEVVEETVKKIDGKVESLTIKPAKRWDSLVDKIILTVAAAVIGFILAKIGF